MSTKDQSTQTEQQLELILALDKARDTLEVEKDPQVMFEAILQLLQTHFRADAGGITLLTEDGSELESMAYAGADQTIARELCRKAMTLPEPSPLATDHWAHTLGMHIVRDEDGIVLGGLFIARKSTPFAESDIALLKVAESQIDSAVLQARMVWKLASRNTQLEAIYQIDRARDDSPDEGELIGRFLALLTEYFQAELCLMFLSHLDSGEMLLRGVIDRENIPADTFETIRQLTGSIVLPQTIATPPAIGQLNLLAAPLIVAGVRLGAVVVGRKPLFTLADHNLLFAMMTQIDSAVVHCRVIQQLNQRTREIETIYRIDQIRDKETDLDRMSQRVLHELCTVVASEIGFLMLFTETEEHTLELKAATVEGILSSPAYQQAIHRYSRKALESAQPIYSNTPDGPVRSVVAIPLILNEEIIGVFGTINSRNPRGFSAEDRRILQAITSQVDTAVFERLERRRIRRAFSRSVDPKVIDHLLNRAGDDILGGERVVITALFADLRESTAWTERIEPEQLVATLNKFLGAMTDVVFKHEGTLDKFVGDEVIALFGTPMPLADHALRAVRCALEMRATHKQLQADLWAQGIDLPSMGIGISTGEVIAGEVGSPIRTEFTALGRAMNLCARLCGVAAPEQILICCETRDAVVNQIEARELESLELKGRGQVRMYELLRVKE